jgi:putative membrane protein
MEATLHPNQQMTSGERNEIIPVTKAEGRPTQSLAKGIVAGLVGGLVATAARSLSEKIYPPVLHAKPEPPLIVAEKTNGHELVVHKPSKDALKWGIGAVSGAAYGAVAEYYPTVTANEGTNFAMTMVALNQDGPLSALGLAPAKPSVEKTAREHSSEIASFIVFGVVTETVRRIVRTALR